jgi:hypothetical protein
MAPRIAFRHRPVRAAILAMAACLLLAGARQAQAVPSFAEQTGQPCAWSAAIPCRPPTA